MAKEPPIEDKYSRLIVDNLDFIERQCRRAVSRGIPSNDDHAEAVNLDNDADEVLIEVLDRLKANDYRALREFQGMAKLTTYITTIISNLVIDIVRSRKGRSRARERAQDMGDTAIRLHDMVYTRGLSVANAQVALEVNFGIREPLDLLHDLLGRMRGREQGHVPVSDGSAWLAPGQKIVDENGGIEVEVADPHATVEKQIMNRQRQTLARQTVDELRTSLTGKERFMMQLRFPTDEDEKPRSMREIGELVGLSEKAVDACIRRILKRCCEMMLRRGLALDDLIDV